MVYISPIDLCSTISEEMEDNLLKVVHSYGFNVDKEELKRALNYDRNQYDIGYSQGLIDAWEKAKKIIKLNCCDAEKCCLLISIMDRYQGYDAISQV